MKLGPPLFRFFRAVIIAFLVVIIISEVLLYAPPAQPRLTSSLLISESSGSTYDASYKVTTTFEANFNFTATIVNGTPLPRPLFLYYDAAYPSSWSLPIWSFGLYQHLNSVLAARGVYPEVVLLDAAQLYGFLTNPSTTSSILLMPTGVIPDTVYNDSVNYLAPWIRAGGTLLWFGDTIGYYSGQKNTPLTYPSPDNPGLSGVSQFVNVSLLGSSATAYPNQSAASRAFGFSYDFGISNHGLKISIVESSGGEVLGSTTGNFTNAARLPLGRGTIDYFSIPLFYDVTELSVSLANMLQSGVLTGPFLPVGLDSFSVSGGASYSGVMPLSIPYLPWANSSTNVCVLLYQSGLLALYANLVCLQIGQSAG
jgi:hypothetical protein